MLNGFSTDLLAYMNSNGAVKPAVTAASAAAKPAAKPAAAPAAKA
jgi:biopolymer transport protein ExbB